MKLPKLHNLHRLHRIHKLHVNYVTSLNANISTKFKGVAPKRLK